MADERPEKDGEPSDQEKEDETTHKPSRRVVDFDMDDNDWEDVDDTQLRGLGTTTHRSRNCMRPSIPVRKHRRVVAGPNVRATADKRRKESRKRLEALAADLDEWEEEHEERIHLLAEKHGMKAKEVRRRMLASTSYKATRKVSLYNAKISRIMALMNEGRGLGDRYTMPEVKRMAADDPSLLEGFTDDVKSVLKTEDGGRRSEVGDRRRSEVGG
ncbi:hypothetical protein C8R45DRAFT_943285 [Mycena sanguinolenta]|nr:hypothetical protein C8R45DRAFT_943285 [Mycena sanguinolenta]